MKKDGVVITFLILSSSLFLSTQSWADPNLSQQPSTSPSFSADDAALKTVIKAKLATETEISPFIINVTEQNGNVTLSGQVDNDHQFEKAVMIAFSIPGVKEINTTDLRIKNSVLSTSDLTLSAKAKGALLSQKVLQISDTAMWPLMIEAKDGVVFITGEVNSPEIRNNVLSTIKTVSGVKSVESSLKAKGETSTPNNTSSTSTPSSDTQSDNKSNSTSLPESTPP